MSTDVATGLLDRRRTVRLARERRRRTVLLGVVAGCAVLAGAWWIANGPLLAVKDVSISGYRQPDQARLVETVRIAARHGTMLKLPTVAVREALLPFPWVAGVRLHHNWLRGVDVEVIQATPVAIATTEAGARLMISDAGRVLGPDASRRNLPRFEVPTARVGEMLRGHAQRGPFLFLRNMSRAAALRISDLRFVGGVITGHLTSGLELRVGPPRDLWAKARSFEAVILNPKLAGSVKEAAYLDLSATRQPTLGGIGTVAGADQGSGDPSAAMAQPSSQGQRSDSAP